MRQALTVGFEEEFLLVDVDGAPLPRADEVLSWLRANLEAGDSTRFKPELKPFQVEAVTLVHTNIAALRTDLSTARSRLAKAGHDCELAVLPVGSAPTRYGAGGDIDEVGRYALISDRYREMTRTYAACGAHVHVGVEDLDQAVAVVNHLRPWLPSLIAVGANSPFHDRRDSGYSSWRVAEQARFPGSGLPPYARSADDYDNRVATLVECGVLIDQHMSFWLARPSESYPTVEVRAADTAATVDDAVLQAVLTRGLVQTALRKLAEGIEGPRIDDQVGAAAVWSAARYGLTGPAIDPIEQIQVPAVHMLGSLIAWIADALEESDDAAVTRQLLTALHHHGTGAARQRIAARMGGGLVDAFRLTCEGMPLSADGHDSSASSAQTTP
jgi:carboxylate-amine ligase